jgi:hypothetical protein
MIATYLTILVVSSLGPDDNNPMAYAYKDAWDCSDMLMTHGETMQELGLMGRCIRTNIITSTSTPMMRPDDLMGAYDD